MATTEVILSSLSRSLMSFNDAATKAEGKEIRSDMPTTEALFVVELQHFGIVVDQMFPSKVMCTFLYSNFYARALLIEIVFLFFACRRDLGLIIMFDRDLSSIIFYMMIDFGHLRHF